MIKLFNDMTGEQFQGWYLEKRIGAGKSAAVYRATKGEHLRAVKIYDPAFAKMDIEFQKIRLKRQEEIGKHNHPNLVKIYAAGVDDTTKFMFVVMDLFDGWSDLAAARTSVPPHRVPAIIQQIASAARFLETEFRTIHRDIKPANIVIAPDHSRAVLLDLGVIKPITSESTKSYAENDHAQFVGTFRYSPHEYADGAWTGNRDYLLDPEAKSDATMSFWRAVTFYQIGTVLYELMTRKLFFHECDDRSWNELAQKKRTSRPADLADLSHPLLKLAHDLLDPDPKTRMLAYDDPTGGKDWARFDLEHLAYRPTVVLLYTGGTFGSVTLEPSNSGEVRQRRLRSVTYRKDPYLDTLSERIRRDFRMLYAPLDGVPFDLQWEIMPPQDQLLSENATPEFWNALTASIQQITSKYCVVPTREIDHLQAVGTAMPVLFRESPGDAPLEWTADERRRVLDDLKSRYLAGIVVFHGTDTMAYSANAIAFGVSNLPCPIVLTGANNPPRAEEAREKDLLWSMSDAWKNAARALHFLAAFGHRFTESFVVFGDTVHHAINLRKVSLTSLITARRGDELFIEEPFVYRNQGFFGDYMFKSIEGLYCNNFYPHNGQHFNFMTSSAYEDYRHRRWDWRPSGKEIVQDLFAAGVHFVKVAPSMPGGSLPRGTRVLLVEGYSSGTVPTAEGTEFKNLFRAARESGVPVVLISESGLLPTRERYEETLVGPDLGRMIRLFGITRESALPLIARILHSIGDAWSADSGGGDPANLQENRSQTLELRLRQESQERKNILSSVLGHVVDEELHKNSLKEQIKRDRGALSAATVIPRHEEPIDPSLPPASTTNDGRSGNQDQSRMQKDELLTHLVRMHAAFDAPGSGPEALSLFCDEGFEWAHHMMSRCLRSIPKKGTRRYVERDQKERETVLDHCKVCVEAVERMILSSHFMTLKISPITEVTRSDIRGTSQLIGLSVQTSRIKERHYGRLDERYSMQGWEDDEAAWLSRLRAGKNLEESTDTYEKRIADEFARLFDNTWNRHADVLDWLALGITRGILAATVRYVEFDGWTNKCIGEMDNGRHLLRESILLSVPTCSFDLLEVDGRYYRRFDESKLPAFWPPVLSGPIV